jgi:hypothetical protein
MANATQRELLYRFRHFSFTNEDHAKEPEQIICDGRFYCSDPRSFNDPFDCAPCFSMSEISIDDQIKRAREMLDRRNLREDSEIGKRVLAAAQGGKFNSPEMRAILPFGMQQSINTSSVCCFNREWQDPRMWAQYASNHEGYCVALVLDENWPKPLVPFPVKYSVERPEIDLSVDTMTDKAAAWKAVEDSVFTKSEHWSGEREVRVFRQSEPAGLMHIPQSLLVEVLLGIRISEENQSRILAAVAKRSHPVPVWKLKVHSRRYEFEREQLM